jgi:hypothetical protein
MIRKPTGAPAAWICLQSLFCQRDPLQHLPQRFSPYEWKTCTHIRTLWLRHSTGMEKALFPGAAGGTKSTPACVIEPLRTRPLSFTRLR